MYAKSSSDFGKSEICDPGVITMNEHGTRKVDFEGGLENFLLSAVSKKVA